MAEINGGNFYDINKQLILQNEKPLTKDQIEEAKELISNYFKSHKEQYFMLLCHEQRDYTIFNFTHPDPKFPSDLRDAKEEVILCLNNRGTIVSIEPADKNNSAIEIWIEEGGEAYCYYLFPYDEGVIEI